MANSKNEIRLEKSMKVLNKMKREQARTIKKMYEDVLEDVKSYNFSNSELENIHLNDLKESILRNLKNINGKLEMSLKNKMKYVSASVIDDVNSVFYVNKDVKAQLKAGFADVPFDVVNNVCNGKVYADNWKLSSAIWGDYEKKKDDINYILAQGRAKNKTAYEIAKDLEKYVDPSARKDWSWSKVYPNSNKVVDYNAQRLVRTLLHHAYQQSLEVAIADNPYIEYVKWHSALDEKRTCKLCKERHGKLYPKGEIPLDHPNGLCTLIPQLNKDLSTIGKELAEQAKYGGDKEFEKWMKKKKKKEIEKVAKQTKKATAKDLKEIKEKLNKEVVKVPEKKIKTKEVVKVAFESIVSKLGKDYADKMNKVLQESNDLSLASLFNKFSSRLKVGNTKSVRSDFKGSGSYFDPVTETINFDAEQVAKGNSLKKPFQVVFHEFGHNIDYLAGSDRKKVWFTNDYKDGALKKAIKSDYEKLLKNMEEKQKEEIEKIKQIAKNRAYESLEKDMKRSESFPFLFSRQLKAKRILDADELNEIKKERSEVYENKIKTKEIFKKHEKEILDFYFKLEKEKLLEKDTRGRYTNFIPFLDFEENLKLESYEDLNFFLFEKIKEENNFNKENMGNFSCLSDAFEYCGKIDAPFDSGHTVEYFWNNGRDTNRISLEFFAEYCESKIANKEEFELTKKYLPTAITICEEMVKEMLKNE